MLSQLSGARKMGGVRGVGILMLIPAGLLVAATPSQVERNIKTTAAPRISISNTGGKVVVKGWDRLQVHVHYSSPSSQVAVDTDEFPTQGPVDKLHFTTYVVNHSAARQTVTVDYTLQVPTGSSLEIHNPQGMVQVESVRGDTSVDSLGADISVADAGGHLAVRSVGGNIEIVHPSGRVEAYSINGNLHFVDPTSSRLHGTTTSGNIVYDGNFKPGGDYVLSDYSGNMDIICPPSASFELNAKTVRGKVDNSFPLVSRPSSGELFSSANSLFGTYSTGEATLELTSFSGSIRIRQK
ncbi:MAG TPA: DUF4097 family beta strand repeat-containing protein [Terriglobia bacterium]|nr:DUF4097 family beta strand repeat-containing protein [Terriglobia bacterium]